MKKIAIITTFIALSLIPTMRAATAMTCSTRCYGSGDWRQCYTNCY